MGAPSDPQDPEWLPVIGGPAPTEIVVRDVLLSLSLPIALLLLSSFLAPTLSSAWRIVLILVSLFLSAFLVLVLRQKWLATQAVRVIGCVLEHRDGTRIERVALTRAILSPAQASPSMLVMVLDDGNSQVALGRRGEPHEINDLPTCPYPYLELEPEHFEEIRIAAQRSYPRA